MKNFIRRLWARFRRRFFHPWVHWLGYVEPRFHREWDFYNVEHWDRNHCLRKYRVWITCECGKTFYKGN